MKVLQEAYEVVADPEKRQARIVVVVGEAGFGKTRLVQQFFRWLSTEKDGVGKEGYWPDELERDGVNLTLNPTPCNSDNKQNFIWAATRLPVPLERNAIPPSGLLAGLLEHFFVHSLDFYRRRENERIADKVNKLTREAMLDIALESVTFASTFFPGAGLLISLARKGWENKGLRDESKELASFASSDARRRKTDDLSSRFLEALGDMYDPSERFGRGLPIVFFIDDVHWLEQDPGLSKALVDLISNAIKFEWPILFILTSRVTEWQQGLPIRELIERHPSDKWTSIVLHKHSDLSPMLRAAFQEELLLEHSRTILDKADGNPLLLDQIISLLREKRRYHIDNDCSKPLNPIALETLDEKTFEIHTIIEERLEQADGEGNTIRDTLALSSAQGSRFLTSLTQDLVDNLAKSWSAKEAIDAAVNPYALVIQGGNDVADFSQNAVYKVVQNILRNDYPASLAEINNALAKLLKKRLRQKESNSITNEDRLTLYRIAASFTESNDQELSEIGAIGLGKLAQSLYLASDFRSAHIAALQFKSGWQAGRWKLSLVDAGVLQIILSALQEFEAPEDCRDFAMSILKAIKRLYLDNKFSARQYVGILSGVAWTEFYGGKLSEAQKLWQETVDLLKDIGGLETRLTYAAMCRNLASVAFQQGDYERADKQIDDGLSIYYEFPIDTAPHRTLPGRSELVGWQAEIAFRRGKVDVAERARYTQLAYVRQLASLDDSPQVAQDLAYCLTKTATLLSSRGKYNEARTLTDEAIVIARNAVTKQNTPASKRVLGLALETAIELASELGDDTLLSAFQLEALTLARDNVGQRATIFDQEQLASVLSQVANYARKRGDLTEAEQKYREALQINEHLAVELGSTSARKDEATSLLSLASILVDREIFHDAEALTRKAYNITRVLEADPRAPYVRRDLLTATLQLARIAYRSTDLVSAERFYREALDIARSASKQLETKVSRRDLYITVARTAEIALIRGNLVDATSLHTEALELARLICKDSDTLQSHEDLSIELLRSAKLAETNMEFVKANAYSIEAFSVCRDLAQKSNRLDKRLKLSSMLEGICYDIYRCDKSIDNELLWQEVLVLNREIVKESPTTETLRALIAALYPLVSIAIKHEKKIEAERLCEEIYDTSLLLIKQSNTEDTRDLLIRSLRYLKALARQRGSVYRANALQRKMIEVFRLHCMD